MKYPSYLMLTGIVITITRNNHSYGVQVTMFEGTIIILKVEMLLLKCCALGKLTKFHVIDAWSKQA